MKLRNLLLTCALVITAALPASAAVTGNALQPTPFAAYAADTDLTIDNVTQAYMVLADIDAKSKADPAFKAKLDGMAPSEWGSDPDASAMLSKAGIDAATFASVFMTYMKAATAAGMIKGGADRASTIAQMQTTDAAVDFVLNNGDALKALDGKYPNAMVQAP